MEEYKGRYPLRERRKCMSKVIRTQKPSVLPWYAAALVFAVLCAVLPAYKLWALLAALGDPHKKLRFVHVAGTNGKGSTAAMLAAMPSHTVSIGHDTSRMAS